MTYKTDNRWSPAGSGATVPDDAAAVYSARWIDHGTWADILPDRQGFAYNDGADRDRLIAKLKAAGLHRKVGEFDGDDDVTTTVYLDGWSFAYRRAGGYIYVCAHLVAEPATL